MQRIENTKYQIAENCYLDRSFGSIEANKFHDRVDIFIDA